MTDLFVLKYSDPGTPIFPVTIWSSLGYWSAGWPLGTVIFRRLVDLWWCYIQYESYFVLYCDIYVYPWKVKITIYGSSRISGRRRGVLRYIG